MLDYSYMCKSTNQTGVNSAVHTSRKLGSGKPVEKGNLKEESTPYTRVYSVQIDSVPFLQV